MLHEVRVDLYIHQAPDPRIDAIIAHLQTLTAKVTTAMSTLDDNIAALTAEVAAESQVEASAVLLLNGIPALITDAVSKALAAGATPAQLQAITDATAAITASSSSLATAVTANTPAAPPAPAPAP